MPTTGSPDLTIEVALGARFGWPVFSVDEVGRGSVAGPVHVGVAALDGKASTVRPPLVKDSKVLSKAQRELLFEEARDWASVVVGQASASEVDVLGITASLRLACERALEAHVLAGRIPRVILLDGSYDWLSRAPMAPEAFRSGLIRWDEIRSNVPVVTKVKADSSCTGVAAASVVAKVIRDREMSDLSQMHPGYGFERNAGYATRAHVAALKELGLSPVHRLTFCRSLVTTQETVNGEEVAK